MKNEEWLRMISAFILFFILHSSLFILHSSFFILHLIPLYFKKTKKIGVLYGYIDFFS